jgi:tetratricopeptide (TPR) repeat protein
MSRADRRRVARAKPSPATSRYESAYVGTEGLFFQRLRAQAKWMFVFLALVFGVSFVFFGVGGNISGTGVADILGFGGGGTGQASVDDAQEKLDKNPADAEALRELATAYQTEGKPAEAISPLEQYTALKPKDEDALRELAGLYLSTASQARNDLAIAQQQAALLNPGADFLPPSSTPLGQALANVPITQALTTKATTAANDAYQRYIAAYTSAKDAYQKIAKLAPTDANAQYSLADAAQNAGDTTTAIAAFKQFVKLAPDDPNAAYARQQIKQLQQSSSSAGGSSPGG